MEKYHSSDRAGIIVACIRRYGVNPRQFQFHRPLIACTLVQVVRDMKTGIIIGGTLEVVAWAG
ncbi:PTS sugar transporter subunit IIC [Shigella flexneri]